MTISIDLSGRYIGTQYIICVYIHIEETLCYSYCISIVFPLCSVYTAHMVFWIVANSTILASRMCTLNTYIRLRRSLITLRTIITSQKPIFPPYIITCAIKAHRCLWIIDRHDANSNAHTRARDRTYTCYYILPSCLPRGTIEIYPIRKKVSMFFFFSIIIIFRLLLTSAAYTAYYYIQSVKFTSRADSGPRAHTTVGSVTWNE